MLKVKHLILLGHSQCGGIQALLESTSVQDSKNLASDDFITSWVSLIKTDNAKLEPDDCAKLALNQSYQNCMTFPWIHSKVIQNELHIHLWFFDIKMGQIFTYSDPQHAYQPLDSSEWISLLS